MKPILICTVALLCLGGTAAVAGNYEILYDVRTGSGWYGGDDRPGSTRDTGCGQSVLVDADILLESFSFYLVTHFDYVENPDGTGHEVTLTLHVRDNAGTILKTVTVDLPATYSGGWVTWTGIDLDVAAGTLLIFTSYLNGAYTTHQYWSGQASDIGAGYADGARYTKNGTGDADMELWAGWGPHIWDSAFWLQGSTTLPVEETTWGGAKAAYAGGQ